MTRSTLLPFDEIEEGPVLQHHVFALRSDVIRSRVTGRTVVADRLLVPDWVNVVALAHDDDTNDVVLVLVRQWRYGSKDFSLEVPAGLVEPGEDATDAGVRELLEETGFAPVDRDAVRVLGRVKPNPALMNNHCTTLLVPRAVRVAAPTPDPGEEIETITVPLARVDDMIADGSLDSALAVVALSLFRLYEARDSLR